jgi:tripartite motif-containing protein 71
VSDFSNHRVQLLNPDGTYIRSFGSKGNGDGQFNYPLSIAFTRFEDNQDKYSDYFSNGQLAVADYGNNRIQFFTIEGQFVRKFGTPGSVSFSSLRKIIEETKLGNGDGQLKTPIGLTINNQGHLIITDSDNHRVQIFDSDGTFLSKFGIQKPSGM